MANNKYRDRKLRGLRAPARDADALGRVLADPAIGDFEVELSLNETCSVLQGTIGKFFAGRGTEDLLLLHLSCHGLKDDEGRLFFAASDTKFSELDWTAVPAEFVQRQMSRSRSRRIVLLLDCCYSGAFARGTVARAGQGVHLKEQFEGRGRAVLTASSATEYSFDGDERSDDESPSIFTSAVVNALKTGEADRNPRNGRISVDELYDYVYDEVLKRTPKQRPGKWLFDVQGDLDIARSPLSPRAEPAASPASPPKSEAHARPGVDWSTGGLQLVLHVKHEDSSVRGVAFSPNRRLLGTAGSDNTARLWEVPSGYERNRLTHDNPVRALAFSPDGRYVATAGSDKTARLWEVASGDEHARLTHDFSRFAVSHHRIFIMRALAFSPDGRYIATAGDDRTARLWEVASGHEHARLTHNDAVAALAFSPDGRYIATVSDDTVRQWEVASGDEHGRLDGASAVAFSPDGRYLATAHYDTVYVWEPDSDHKHAHLPHDDAVKALAFSPDGRYLATVGNGGGRLWEVASGHEHALLGGASAVAFSPEGRYLATVHNDTLLRTSHTVDVWEVASGHEHARLPHDDAVMALAFSADGRYLATAGGDTGQVWETTIGTRP